jgi:hypothetical protein
MNTYKILVYLNKCGQNLLRKTVYPIFESCENPEELVKSIVPESLIDHIESIEISHNFTVGDIVKITKKGDGRCIITEITEINFYPNPKTKILEERISVKDSLQTFSFSGLPCPNDTQDAILEPANEIEVKSYEGGKRSSELIKKLVRIINSGSLDVSVLDEIYEKIKGED